MKLIIWITLLTCTSGIAATVADNAHFFPYFEKLMSTQSFNQAHPCGLESYHIESVDTYEVHCSDDGWGHSCVGAVVASDKYYKNTVQVCNENEQHIISESGDYTVYTKQMFELNKKQYIKNYLAEIDQLLGYEVDVVIDRFQPGKMTLAQNTDRARKIEVINIFGTINFKDLDYSTNFILSTSDKVPAGMQVLRFRMDDSNWLRFFDYKAGNK